MSRNSPLRLSSENQLAAMDWRQRATARHVDTSGCAVPRAAGRYGDGIRETRHKSKYKMHIDALCVQERIPLPMYEYQFHPTRAFRFDAAWVGFRIALELDGGIWMQGGAHALPTNILRDMEKGNLAVMSGWRLLRFTPDRLSGAVIAVRELIWRGGA